MKGKVQEFFTHEKVLLASRLLLGSIFIAASIGKLQHPGEFTTLVASYNILPYSLAAIYGYLVPWVEFIIGSLLILGLLTRFASALSIPIIISFIIASSHRLLIGAGGGCGCFGGVMPLTLTQSLNLDALMLLLTIPLMLRKASLLSLRQWLADSGYGSLRTREFAFNGASKLLAIIAIITLLVSSSPQTVQAIITSDQEMVTSQPDSAKTIVLNEEIQKPAGVKNVIKAPAANTVQNVSLDARINTALETQEAVFVLFYADWCGYCQKQKPILDILEPEFSSDITFMRVNVDENRQAMQQFGVTGFPSMFLITGTDSAGSFVQQKFTGFTDEAKLKASLSQTVTGGGQGQDEVDYTIKVSPPSIEPVSNQSIVCFSYNEEYCGTNPLCEWCDSQELCQPIDSPCTACKDVAFIDCGTPTGYPGCKACLLTLQCQDENLPCYCGNGDLNVGEECDSTPNCDPIMCTCEEGYIPDPNNPPYCCCDGCTCNGISATDSSVCSGNGVCMGADTCLCFDGWTGSDCSTPADQDGDGVRDDLDNCREVPNPDQTDTDGD
ncbi:MAG: MauE/DoxX family redox-associated membrane protein, partial [Dehalococcoidales bacterium]